MEARPSAEAIAHHLLVALREAGERGERTNVEELSRTLGIRKTEARAVLSELDRKGLVDVLRMHLTLVGFGVAESLKSKPRPSLRRQIPARALRTAA
jgi:Mn-dependent DtxR family transcriptional regulator